MKITPSELAELMQNRDNELAYLRNQVEMLKAQKREVETELEEVKVWLVTAKEDVKI